MPLFGEIAKKCLFRGDALNIKKDKKDDAFWLFEKSDDWLFVFGDDDNQSKDQGSDSEDNGLKF